MTKKKDIKTWKDIADLKQKKDIKLNGKVLFSMVELSAKDIDDFIQDVYNTDELDKDAQEVELSNERIGQLLRKMVKGIEFENLTDIEIVDVMNTFGEDIVMQINDCVNEFVTQKVYKRLENFSSFVDQLSKIDKAAEKVENITKNKGGVVQ